MLDVIIAIASLILGVAGTLFITNYTIIHNKRMEMSFEIKNIFITDLMKIRGNDSSENEKANIITVNNIRVTYPIINRYFRYTNKRNRKKIERHYNEYKEPYKSIRKDPLDILSTDNEIIYPSEYYIKDIPNAYKRTIKYFEVLINDF